MKICNNIPHDTEKKCFYSISVDSIVFLIPSWNCYNFPGMADGWYKCIPLKCSSLTFLTSNDFRGISFLQIKTTFIILYELQLRNDSVSAMPGPSRHIIPNTNYIANPLPSSHLQTQENLLRELVTWPLVHTHTNNGTLVKHDIVKQAQRSSDLVVFLCRELKRLCSISW